MTPKEMVELRKYIDINLKQGFIEPAKSEVAALVLFKDKKDSRVHLCIDLCGINDFCTKNTYPIPLMLNHLAKGKVFTKLDLREAYYHIQKHMKLIRQVLEKLLAAKLYRKLSKCEFHKISLDCLGYHISSEGIEMYSRKVKAVLDWKSRSARNQLQSFLGFANFYRQFITAFAEFLRSIESTQGLSSTFHLSTNREKPMQLWNNTSVVMWITSKTTAQQNENQLTFLTQSSLVKRNYRMMQGFFSNLGHYQKFFQMIFVLGIGGNLIVGYQISVINYPSVYIKRFMNESWLERTGAPLNEKMLIFLWSFAVSVYGVGGLLGCLCSGFLTVKYGKPLPGHSLSVRWRNFPQEVARTCKCYLRILLVSGEMLGPNLGTQEGDEEGCLKAMHQLWGQGDHKEELEELKKEMVPGGQRSKVLWPGELFHDASLRQQLSILVAVIVTVQFCGINAVYFYAFEVLQNAGLEERLIPYIALGIGFSELFSSFICIFTIEQYGRRPLLWKGCGSMALVLFFLTGTLSLQKSLPWMSLCSVILIFLLVILFGVGPNGATFSIMMEIFSQSARAAAFTIGGCLNWAGLFVIGIAFPFAEESLGPFCFLLFATVLSGSGIFFYLFLPETKGKSAVEITEEFSRSSLGKKLAVLGKNFSEDHSVYSSF
ncbi:solute carrier family 2, facilitated glucose transporter member 11-like [Thamnophis elegans]|uniref:solute carrier family 2, facilitated glucose transporter member 11-like n=1 Tax=Thamnophis elegans TaxID=35005 RepID=UPI0013776027|nr:solute carrier family 2, facilitated glucose transporter member 11-like [Thamnophis elegans]